MRAVVDFLIRCPPPLLSQGLVAEEASEVMCQAFGARIRRVELADDANDGTAKLTAERAPGLRLGAKVRLNRKIANPPSQASSNGEFIGSTTAMAAPSQC